MNRFEEVCKEVTSNNYNYLSMSLKNDFCNFYYRNGINELSEDIYKENFEYFKDDWNDWLLK